MADNTEIKENAQGGNTEQQQGKAGEEKRFTQSDVDRIVESRLAREKDKQQDIEELKAKAAKYDELAEKNKSELEKATEKAAKLEAKLARLKKDAEIRKMREAVASETKIPINLLTGDDEETCKAQAKAILEFAQPGQSHIPDGGDPGQHTSGKTRDQFADWFNQSLKR